MGRAPCCDKANVKRGPWSPEEDADLRSYIHKHGSVTNWIALPNKAGLKRCGKSCRLRWLNYLRPDIKHGCFTKEEDDIISTLFLKIGSRWSAIASKLPGRTDNDVKNYWNTKLKKRVMEAMESPYDSHHKSSGPPLLASKALNPSVHSLSSISSAPIQVDYQGSSCASNESLNFKPPRQDPSSLEFNYGSIADLLSSSNFEETLDRLWA